MGLVDYISDSKGGAVKVYDFVTDSWVDPTVLADRLAQTMAEIAAAELYDRLCEFPGFIPEEALMMTEVERGSL